QSGNDRSGPGVIGQDRSSQVRDFSADRERVTGVEPATLCLASTRSSQLSYTRKSEEVLVAPRAQGGQGRPFHPGERGVCPWGVPITFVTGSRTSTGRRRASRPAA